MLVADPERHLPVKGDGRVFRRGAFILGVAAFSCGPAGGSGAYGQGRAPFAFEQHLKAEAGIVQNGLELEGKRRAFDPAGHVRVFPEQVVFLAHRPEEP